jgi:Dephospho-CoA kinase
MKIICIAGMPLSGKTTAANFLNEIGYSVVSMGDIIRNLYKKENSFKGGLEEYIIFKRKEMGNDYFARMCKEYIKRIKDVAIIDGVRSLEEAEYFKDFGEVYIVAIHASPSTRFKRALKRKREDDPESYEEFKKRDLRELGFGLGNLISLADYMLVNEYDKDYLRDNIIKVVEKILNENRSNC